MEHLGCDAITFNLFHDLPLFRHLDSRLEAVASAIAHTRPHLVALQEVAKANGCGDLSVKLHRFVNDRARPSTNYTIHYARADQIGEAEYAFEEGLAILTRLPSADIAPEVLKYQNQVELVADFGGQKYRLPDDRIAIRMRFQIGDHRELDFYVTHLTDRSEVTTSGTSVREAQAGELLRWSEQASGGEVTALIAGDFNDVPDSATVRALTESGFVDLWAATHQGAGFTNDCDDIELESPNASHNRRIDYLFCRPARNHALRISGVTLFLDQALRRPNGQVLWPSDHIGVKATLRL